MKMNVSSRLLKNQFPNFIRFFAPSFALRQSWCVDFLVQSEEEVPNQPLY